MTKEIDELMNPGPEGESSVLVILLVAVVLVFFAGLFFHLGAFYNSAICLRDAMRGDIFEIKTFLGIPYVVCQ